VVGKIGTSDVKRGGAGEGKGGGVKGKGRKERKGRVRDREGGDSAKWCRVGLGADGGGLRGGVEGCWL